MVNFPGNFGPSFSHRDTELTITYRPEYFCKNSGDQLRSYSKQANKKTKTEFQQKSKENMQCCVPICVPPLSDLAGINREEPFHSGNPPSGWKQQSWPGNPVLWLVSGLPEGLVSVLPDSEHWQDWWPCLEATESRCYHYSTLELQFHSQMPGTATDCELWKKQEQAS